MKPCGCGCGTSLDGARRGSKYASDACRTRAWRQRRERSGKPSPKRHRAPDLRLSYSKVLEAVAQDFARLARFDMHYARRRAAETLDPLLTDRQRKHLQERAK